MPYDITYVEEFGYHLLIYSGKVTRDDILALFEKALAQGTAHNCFKFLADLTGMTEGPSIIDLFSLVMKMIALPQEMRGKGFKEAIILPHSESLRKGVRFYQTACRNRSIAVELFTDQESAIEWLLA